MQTEARRIRWCFAAARRGAGSNLAAVCLASLISLTPAAAVTSARLSGNLGGVVTDVAGKPQMGAAVMLFNRQSRPIQRALTDDRGSFGFGALPPDSYSVRVSLARYLPAFRDHIDVRPGVNSFLDVSLSSLFSSIQLVPMSNMPAALMSDDWKWALRTSSSSRPITRILPVGSLGGPGTQHSAAALFHETRGLVNISGGDSGSAATGETDLGTTFALATSFAGNNRLQIAGNMGYQRSASVPSAALRASFSREIGEASPEVTLIMRQLYLPGHWGTDSGSDRDSSVPPLRTLAMAFSDKAHLSDSLSLEYGFEADSVSFIDHIHYFSPYARLQYALPKGNFYVSYTSGNARPELGVRADDENAELVRDMRTLAMVPRVTLQQGRVKVQRGESYEIGLSEPLGKSRELRLSAYRESVSNAALNIAGATGEFMGDVLPDFFSSAALFNAGDYHSMGYTVALTQELGQNFAISGMYGSVGVLTAKSTTLVEATADDLRRLIDAQRRGALTVQGSGTMKGSGTHFVASYQWLDSRAATPAQLYSTESVRPEPGMDLLIRQPMPSLPGLPAHWQLTAEVRNLLAQGYLPIALPDGRRLVLVNNPRSLRGGLSFSF